MFISIIIPDIAVILLPPIFFTVLGFMFCLLDMDKVLGSNKLDDTYELHDDLIWEIQNSAFITNDV
jgi:hypothetical protein